MTIVEDRVNRTFWGRFWPPRRVHYFALGGLVALVLAVVAAIIVVDSLDRVAVPDVVGQARAEALEAITDAGLEYESDDAASDVECTIEPPLSDFCEVTRQSLTPDERVRPGTALVIAIELAETSAPDVVGLAFDAARDRALEAHLDLRSENELIRQLSGYGDWTILSQTPAAGATVHAGTMLEVVLDTPLVDVPEVVGMPFDEAKTELESVGLAAGFSSMPFTHAAGAILVRTMDPAPADGQLPIGSSVQLKWGVKVPDVVGETEGNAVTILKDADFSVDGSAYGTHRVMKQSPAAGTIADPAKAIELTLVPPTVAYEVVGDGTRATITWFAPGTFDISQATDAQLPWKKTWETESDYRNFNAQTMNGSNITCNIYVNGELRKTNTSTGPYAVVSCG
ncbi:MmpS family transport accessory protein [Microbacterium abyssi]|uniref:MmpS family transport accessory protein n=1 Tax=Microbacterium abyssi TaxID=2782166 RepID=UPI00188744A3|nr:MmpS family transport accessory protein [Microbacterium sp. A18JL241]